MVKQESCEFSTWTYPPFDVNLSILKRVSLVNDDHSMFAPSCYVQCKCTSDQEYESDNSLTWEDFFGTTVEISSGLMDMYDKIIRKDKIEEQHDKAWTDKEALDSSGVNKTANNNFSEVSPSFSNKSLHDETLPGGLPATSSRERNIFPRRSMSATDTYHPAGKKRPLSTSSVSSSSSSSSSSLPRNGIDVKKSYLASIESLDDEDEVTGYGEGLTGAHARRDQLPHGRERRSVGSLSECGGSEATSTITNPSRQTSYDPNLGLIDRVILEIVDTERTYVKDLNEIIEGYLHHIQQSGYTKVSEEILKDLFGNIEDIHTFNNTFLEELEGCGLDPVAVARCFVKNSTGFVIYTQYCTNYPRSVSVIKELMNNLETAEIFKERQLALHHCLPLGSYLLKPVQRILKYHLLLNNIVKYSDKESDGYPDIKNALSVMTGIAYHINDMKKKHEHAVRVQEIQSLLYGWEGEDLTTFGELMAEGTFRMFGAKALRHLFLFNKMLLIAKKKEEGILIYKTHIMCSNLMLIESIQGEPLCFHVIPFDNPRLQYTFQARNMEQKREWCLELKRVILENYNAVIPSHARQLVMELGQNKQEDPISVDKSNTKRQLSAPEYLEKRKQERRKSEISLNRAFKLKKGKHNIHVIWCQEAESQKPWSSKILLPSSSKESLSQLHIGGRIQQTRSSWRTWSSLPEETTDTEVEDNYETLDFSRLLQVGPHLQTTRTQEEMLEDLAGEYVTFVFAHAYACRDMRSLTEPEQPRGNITVQPVRSDKNMVLSANSSLKIQNGDEFRETLTTSTDIRCHRDNSFKSENLTRVKTTQCQNNSTLGYRTPAYSDSLLDFWDKLGRVQVNNICNTTTSSTSSESSWRNSTAVQRAQSFTGITNINVTASHHSSSVHQTSKILQKTSSLRESKDFQPGKLLQQAELSSLPSKDNLSPTAPAVWLSQQKHLADVYSKFGSLPRSFQVSQEYNSKSPTIKETEVAESQRARRRVAEGSRTQYADHRPFTIASDKPCQADLREDLDGYIEDSSHMSNFSNFTSGSALSSKDRAITSVTTPTVSIENVSIHPTHKVYAQPRTRYATLRNVLANFSSKIAALKSVLGSPSNDHLDTSSFASEDNDFPLRFKHGFLQRRSASRSSVKSEKNLNPRAVSANFLHSLAKAYSALRKHRLKKEFMPKSFHNGKGSAEKKTPIPANTHGSSVVGARIAKLHESEYSVPNTLMICRQLRAAKELELRPDSLFSDSSNTTSSSDGDKTSGVGGSVVTRVSCSENSPLVIGNNEDDSTSNSSNDSVDSFYERTFEAIENSLEDEMFRDSAIYSDPEEADLSTMEFCLPGKKQTKQATLDKRKTFNCKFPYCYYDQKYLAQTSDCHTSQTFNDTVVERVKFPEVNTNFQNEVISRHQTEILNNQKEHSISCNHKDHEESETSSEHSTSTVNTVMETCHAKSMENFSQPRQLTGWVKHIVDKLQAESNV
ncbi:uncharacterized protein LOC143223952 [Tachypleus tridentatus]|uniref:uncharacterized protein LOC143223952 n=1 Tax=Tachypleus tridentatus TaxID=6853 RepID=UPI003FD2013C